ncbi:hypothetical protein [Pseudomonas chlororaphis]|uniref:Uncharacterized protein n=1 Tax=Pseudomonas chlororaphis subsp. aurantiaca TaxID=86192 RepID=A0AAJ1E0J8_9PSED|nr:hypothetical protein [Pseudomonas chlororaphis]MBU4632030.1 hypothetical protein [Pseudomonas chlororaphis subsp. aurantiaca]
MHLYFTGFLPDGFDDTHENMSWTLLQNLNRRSWMFWAGIPLIQASFWYWT